MSSPRESRKSRIQGLYKLSVAERIEALERYGWLSQAAARELQRGRQVLSATTADTLIENVIGVFGLPLAVAPNFIINDHDCLVPLVVEEPSIVAGLSAAAAMARNSGGFLASCAESLVAGQIHITNVNNVDAALAALREAAEEIIRLAEAVHPRLSARGGGVRDVEFRSLLLPDGTPLITIHIYVDTCDAMGANLVNTICETVAPAVVKICGGNVALRILSNLAERSIANAQVRYSLDTLASDDLSGEQVRDRVVLANDIACVDPHRATTHNKGIMNGIDALAIATGNDWRAIEAGVHAYAARDGVYSALTRWSVGKTGDLLGEINVPLKTGIVGGTLESNPAAALALAIANVESAMQLSEMMAAVGLAQNFAALRALVTGGIQKGHMRLHARSVAAAAGAPEGQIGEVVEKLIASGEIKGWKAEQIVSETTASDTKTFARGKSAAGKVILIGEHAVVYGRHALALPILDAVSARATLSDKWTSLSVDDWQIDSVCDRNSRTGVDAAINLILAELGAGEQDFRIAVRSRLPRGMGLGSSAAIAVAITRAVAHCLGITVDDKRINEIAFQCEKIAHGNPSGIDNAISCYGKAMLFRNTSSLNGETSGDEMTSKATIETVITDEEPPLVIAFSHDVGSTLEQVAGVRQRYDQNTAEYEAVFEQIDDLALRGAEALRSRQYDRLGPMMNVCHGLLNALQVSTPDIEYLVALARSNGAAGAKLTGAGGGGAIVALCPNNVNQVTSAIRKAGYQAMEIKSLRQQ